MQAMRATHALFIRIPDALKSEDKKRKIDIDILKRQQDELRATLYEAGVQIIELPILEKSAKDKDKDPASSILVGDLVIVIRGIALLTRPKKEPNAERMKQIATTLRGLTWAVHETPKEENGNKCVLEGGDVLFTGREIFVGIRKGATNVEGAMVLARTFRDFPVITLFMNDKNHPLRHHLSMVNDKVIAVGTSKEAQSLLERVEREASFRYKRITVDDEAAVGCLNVNDRLLFRSDTKDAKYNILQGSGIELWGMDVTELAKAGTPFSRHCVLIDADAGNGRSSAYNSLTRSVTKSIKTTLSLGSKPTNGTTHVNGASVKNGDALQVQTNGASSSGYGTTDGASPSSVQEGNGTTIVTSVHVHQ
ncbi:hypothetical protein PRIPAC_70790 [Pristionchus pacificus]|uniref:Dimethylargininase n=1 Tax=Pristionchus pacificus TaxID=54126 RepID=A0A8R1U3R0_PRIPA|nr:hypothetical protein PRIPAC_70790 [Pristionchus pacificus]|eukprot:PDM65040.1 hypothetical protein PRIPAC_53296 [Pristionchus pacificus]